MSTLENRLRDNMIRSMVQHAIFCEYTQEVLDYRTCIVFLDADGDPMTVVSPSLRYHPNWPAFTEALARRSETIKAHDGIGNWS